MLTLPSEKDRRPSLTLPSVNLITSQFYFCLSIGRNSKKTDRWHIPFSATDSDLRHCFSTTEWCVFQDNSIDIYTDISYTGLNINDTVPRITVWTFPSQKLWVNEEVCTKLQIWTDAFNPGHLDKYRKSRYTLSRIISQETIQGQCCLD